MTEKQRVQISIEVAPEERRMFRQVAMTLNMSIAEIIRAHFYALAAENNVEQPDVKRTPRGTYERTDSKPGRKSGGE